MSFEQELIKVIEHGCPCCGMDTLNVIADEETGYLVRLFGHGDSIEIDWYDSHCYKSQNQVVCCQECGEELWTAEDGWIPELAEIVKGE